jgi:hypothetical protein
MGNPPIRGEVKLVELDAALVSFDVVVELYLSPNVVRLDFAPRIETRLNCKICGRWGRTVFLADDPTRTFCTPSYYTKHPFPASIAQFDLSQRESTGRTVLSATYRIACDRSALKGVSDRRPRLRAPFWARVSFSITCACGTTTNTSIQTNRSRPQRRGCKCGLPLYYDVYNAPVFREGSPTDGMSHSWDIDIKSWLRPEGTGENTDPATIVTLVHGTWARGMPGPKRARRQGSSPKWFEPGSAFSDGILRSLSRAGVRADVATFDWSGANSILARESAAQRLAGVLAQQRTNHPESARVVIAHSHGGNVALRAFQFLTDLGSDCGQLSIATIGTPFVSIRANRVLGYDLTVSRTLVASALVTELIRHASIGALWWWGHALVWLVGFSAILFALSLAEGPVLGLDPIEPGTRWRLDELVTASKHPAAREVHLLVVRGRNDEAALAVAAAAIGERITRVSANLLSRIAAVTGLRGPAALLIASGVAIGSLLATHIQFPAPPGMPSLVLSWLWPAFLSLLLIVFGLQWLCAVMSGAFRMLFGRELFNTSLRLEVAAESSPDTTYTARVVTFPDPDATGLLGFPLGEDEDEERRRGRGLRHALYTEPAVVNEIAEWIRTTACETRAATRDEE